jgi:hypothetical protein
MATPLNPDYRLTIQFSLGGLSFALFNTSTDMVADMEFHQSDSLNSSDELFQTLEKDLDSRDLSDSHFLSVTCLIDGRTHTLVPEALYHPEESTKLLGFNFDVPNGYVIESDLIKPFDARLLYCYPEALRHHILSKWPQAEIIHTATVFLRSLPQSDVPMVHVNVRNRDFDMAIMSDQLLFFNNFKFQTKVDFTYYLLFAMQQHELSGLDTTVQFSGLIQPSSEIIDLCRRYLKDIRFVTQPHDFHIKKSLSEIPFHYYYNHYQILK